eukprot:356959-Chlamydomonas_euryale.AAC.1
MAHWPKRPAPAMHLRYMFLTLPHGQCGHLPTSACNSQWFKAPHELPHEQVPQLPTSTSTCMSVVQSST